MKEIREAFEEMCAEGLLVKDDTAHYEKTRDILRKMIVRREQRLMREEDD